MIVVYAIRNGVVEQMKHSKLLVTVSDYAEKLVKELASDQEWKSLSSMRTSHFLRPGECVKLRCGVTVGVERSVTLKKSR
jgi:hypothetical protein